jgi:hypothetical protein
MECRPGPPARRMRWEEPSTFEGCQCGSQEHGMGEGRMVIYAESDGRARYNASVSSTLDCVGPSKARGRRIRLTKTAS